jgi:transposase
MALPPQPIAPVPAHTVRVAAAAFPTGHPSRTLREQLGTLVQDEDCATLCPAWGSPGRPPGRLALVTLMQLRERLADRQAAAAGRARMDWQYLLGVERADPGCDFSVLSACRDRPPGG